MTPTEQDKELRQLVHIIQNADTTYDAMKFITADRKRVELEARIDENKYWKRRIGEHSDEDTSYFDNRIAELKAQQEEV